MSFDPLSFDEPASSPTSPMTESRWRWTRGLLSFAVWMLPLALMMLSSLPWDPSNGGPPWSAVGSQVGYWMVWPVLTPWIFRLGRRFPPGSHRPIRNVLIHLGISLGGGLLLGAYFLALVLWVQEGPASVDGVLATVVWVFMPFSALVYWLVLLVGRSLDGYRLSRERDALLAEARLHALETQLQPHFLFNAMGSISALIDDDPAAAQTMLARLGELLRASLHPGAGQQEVTLDEELSLLRRYLDIEQVRFGDRLRVEWRVEDGLRRVRVPHLLLQPLAENAIRHGIARDSRAGRLEIGARRQGDQLKLWIRDDGPGLGEGPPRQGIGLSNTRARLQHLYGEAADLRLATVDPRGAESVVTMPLGGVVEEGA